MGQREKNDVLNKQREFHMNHPSEKNILQNNWAVKPEESHIMRMREIRIRGQLLKQGENISLVLRGASGEKGGTTNRCP